MLFGVVGFLAAECRKNCDSREGALLPQLDAVEGA